MMRHLILALATLVWLVHPAVAEPTIFLVRHAEKSQAGDAKDPELSDVGHARAAALAVLLKDAGITAIYATEFKRTQQTAEPFAHAAGIKTTIVPAKEAETLVVRLKEAQGNALIIGHSNTIPEILKSLGARDPPPINDSDYDNLFVLVPGPPVQLVRLHYR